ncbi:hypothetical protein [uncultured Ruminococcus sp.]|uniref:hypothetical protein n=1 Tax=uncultured Ruminococcus sp. TaxID=165186 RepID=UPI0025DE9E3A|nr:hypothetical protein [uncultured Ruminococcus sp.]
MTDFAFEKGDDITIKLNGKIIGGVKKVTCNIENTFYDISQFLTDVPVKRITGKRYNIELVMNNAGKLDFLQGQSFDRLEIFNTKKIVTYTDCFVTGVTANISAKNAVEYTVKITARERREI